MTDSLGGGGTRSEDYTSFLPNGCCVLGGGGEGVKSVILQCTSKEQTLNYYLAQLLDNSSVRNYHLGFPPQRSREDGPGCSFKC